MRNVIVWNMMTLDGCFEGTDPWSLDFHNAVWGEELEAFSVEQANEIGTLLFGRKTFEGMAAHWSTETGAIADFMNAVDKVVATGTLSAPEWNNSRLLEAGVPEGIAELKNERGKDIFAFGSAELVASLMKRDLVDEYRICLVPQVLGRGNPLFKPTDRPIGFSLLEARPLQSGAIILRYKVNGRV